MPLTPRPNRRLPMAATLIWCAALAGAAGYAGDAVAQTQRSGGGGASAQIMQQYQQLASERTALQADNAKLKKDVETLTAERDALKKERDALRAKAGNGDASAAKVAAATQAAEENAAKTRKQLDELVAKYRETATTLQGVEKDRASALADAQRRTQLLDACVDKNGKLRALTEDVLNRYEHQGWFSKAALNEPFTRIARNRLENLTDEYRSQADGLTVAPSDAPKP